MSFEQFYRILLARRKLAFSLFMGILLLAGAITALMPKTYTASTQVMIDLKPDPISGLAQIATMQPAGYLATQLNIIKSDAVARDVVSLMQMADNPAMRTKWAKETKEKGSYEDWLGKILLKGLSVKVVRESSIIEIEYESVSPAFAAALANAFARAYIEKVGSMRTEPAQRYTAYFEDRAQLARQKLESAQTRLAEAQNESGILINDERLDNEVARLNEMGSQLVGIRGLLAESNNRKIAINSKADQSQEVLNNSLIASFKAELSRQSTQLNEATAQKGDNHPLVIQLRAGVREIERRIAQETQRVSGSVVSSDNIVRGREAAALKAYEDQRNKLLSLKQKRSDLTVLDREVDSAQRIYDAIQLRQSQSSLESNATQSMASIMSSAVEPPNHSSPRLMLNMIVAVFGGSIFTLLVTMAAELLDRRVRTGSDLIQNLAIPVIGVMPGVAPNRFRLFKKQTYGQLLPYANQSN